MKAWRKYNAACTRNGKSEQKLKKSQRHTTAPEKSQPSGLLYVLFAKAGLPVPDSIDSLLSGLRISR